MKRWMLLAGVLSIAPMICGCAGEGAPAMAARAEVAGTVNLDGKPLNEADAEATISFSLPGQAPVLLPIKDGKFAGQAPTGDTRVEVRVSKQGEPVLMDGKPVEGSGKYNIVAPKFNDQSTLTAKIPAGGVKDLKFDVETHRIQ